jgi:hypothetical protein
VSRGAFAAPPEITGVAVDGRPVVEYGGRHNGHTSAVRTPDMDPFSMVAAEEEQDHAGADLAEGVGSLDDGTFRDFIVALLLAQGGLFAASLGLMLWHFRGQGLLGGGLLAAGAVALVVTVVIVVRYERA